MVFDVRCCAVAGTMAWALGFAAAATQAAAPTAAQALQLQPIQKDLDYDQPAESEAAKCTVKAEQSGGKTGWVVRSEGGEILRRFVDTNEDNVVDLWSYYKNGVEVYRDIDADYDGKADQYRWLSLAGSRWGLDKDEDGTVDTWKTISAEEATAEAVRALADRDAAGFTRLLMTPEELKSLGLGPQVAEDLASRISDAATRFQRLATSQKSVTAKTKWVHFGGSLPGAVPAGTDDSTADVLVYENVVAIVETDGQQGQVQIGTLIRVGDVWRLVDVPRVTSDDGTELADDSFTFFHATAMTRPQTNTAGSPAADEKLQDLLTQVEQLDQKLAEAATLADRIKIHGQRADLLEQIAGAASAEDRAMWYRQMADTVSAAAQSGEYPGGVTRLSELAKKLAASPENRDLAAYVEFRHLTADYGASVQAPGGNDDFVKIQEKWISSLEQFVKKHPESEDAAEAMLQLAMAEEFAGKEKEATAWYQQIVSKHPDSPSAKKATGASLRLNSVGRPIRLAGTSAINGKPVDLGVYTKNKRVVLIHYWATWCEPCKADMALLREMQAKYGKAGLSLIGVNLDNDRANVADFLKQNPLTWDQLYEEGGLDSRLANEMGILTLPTMILVDQKGNVVNRNIHATELDREVRALLSR